MYAVYFDFKKMFFYFCKLKFQVLKNVGKNNERFWVKYLHSGILGCTKSQIRWNKDGGLPKIDVFLF